MGESSIRDILEAVQERAIGAETAASWLEMRIAEARRPRHVQARTQLIDALDSALGGDEFAGLFPPTSPLGGEHEAEPDGGLVYPGEEQGQPGRRPVTSWDGYVSAATSSRPVLAVWESSPRPAPEMDDEEADLLYPPRTSEEADGRARAVRAAAAPLSDDELYDRIFGPLGAAGWD